MQSDVIFSTVYLQFSGNKKQSDDDTPPPAKRGRKPKDATTPATSNPKESEPTNTTSTPKSPRGRKRKTEEKSNEELSADQTKPSNGVSTGAQNRNISCLSDVNAAGSSQREVVVSIDNLVINKFNCLFTFSNITNFIFRLNVLLLMTITDG